MTVRFQVNNNSNNHRYRLQSEYTKSYRGSRSSSISPQRCLPLAGLRSDHMGITREPQLQRRRKLGSAQSCRSVLAPPAFDKLETHRRPVHRKEVERKPSRPPTDKPSSPVEPGTPAGPRSAADPPQGPESDLKEAEAFAGKTTEKPRLLQPDNQSLPSRPVTSDADGQQQQQQQQVDPALWRKAGLKGQRSVGQRSEYQRQFRWRNPAPNILTTQQMLQSSSSSHRHPIRLQTEYQQCFKGLTPPTGPRLRQHFENPQVPLVQSQSKSNRKQENGQEVDSPPEATPPLEAKRQLRNTEGGVALVGDAQQVKELRQKALQYRHRAWGTNFSRNHLSQLLSSHNILWEPPNSPDSSPKSPDSSPKSPDSSPDPLDLASESNRTSSTVKSGGGTRNASVHTEDQDFTDQAEGRLQTPQMKTRPIQRTHLDLTTPSTGGVLLVGELTEAADWSPNKQSRPLAVSTATEEETAPSPPNKIKEAWSEVAQAPASSPSPAHSLKSSAKPMRLKEMVTLSSGAPPTVAPPPQRIQGTMRHSEFQHNGDLGLRLEEFPCSGKGCGSDEDDRISVMSLRSAASCSAASDVLQRALKRRDDFWKTA